MPISRLDDIYTLLLTTTIMHTAFLKIDPVESFLQQTNQATRYLVLLKFKRTREYSLTAEEAVRSIFPCLKM